MKTTIIEDRHGNALLTIPDEVLAHLGWADGDELTIDIPTTGGDSMIIWKRDAPAHDLKVVSTLYTDKSREVVPTIAPLENIV